jgi:hypothetical protein
MNAKEAAEISELNQGEHLKTIYRLIEDEAKRGFKRLRYPKNRINENDLKKLEEDGYEIFGKEDGNSKFYQIRW